MKKRLLCAIVLMALVLSSCGNASAKDEPGYGKWRNSDLVGSLKADEEIRLQDDFAAAANQAVMAGAKPGSGTLDRVKKETFRKMKVLLEEDHPGKEGAELKKYADLAADWQGRKKDGAEPLRPYLERIEEISSMKDLEAYLCDPEGNPSCLGLLAPLRTGQDQTDPTVYSTVIDCPGLSLGDADSYFKMNENGFQKRDYTSGLTGHILGKLGYSDSAVKKILKDNYRFEKKLAACDTALAEEDFGEMLISRKKCIGTVPGYPLEKVLDAWGFPADGHYFMNTESAKKIAALYKEENLEEIRAFFTVHTAVDAARYLDRETFELEKTLSKSRTEITEEESPVPEDEKEDRLLMDYITKSYLGPVFEKEYTDKYVDQRVAEDLDTLTRDIIAEYRKLFDTEDWLSDKGKKACVKKLDAMQVHVVFPDYDMVDYSGLYITPRTGGGTFYRAFLQSEKCRMKHYAGLCSRKFDRGSWDPLTLGTTEVNAFYLPSANGIYIMAGILEDPFYSYDMSYEEKLGGIGTVIGHEITHGFDGTGCKYDASGLKKDWLSVNDQISFADRGAMVSEYYSTIHPLKGAGACDGSRLWNEATADMGGLRITLALAAGRKAFDYDKYFRQYAAMWSRCATEDEERAAHKADTHPLSYLRVNVGLQQFREFQDTYGIREGDGMYLPADKRITVW